MNKVTVFQFSVWDQAARQDRIAPHMATRAFIKMAGGTMIEGSEMEIDPSLVDATGQAHISVQPVRLV